MRYFLFIILVVFSFSIFAQTAPVPKIKADTTKSKTAAVKTETSSKSAPNIQVVKGNPADSSKSKAATAKPATSVKTPTVIPVAKTAVTDTTKSKTSPEKSDSPVKTTPAVPVVKAATIDTVKSKTNSVKTDTPSKTAPAISNQKVTSDTSASKPVQTLPNQNGHKTLAGLKVYDVKDEIFYLDSLSQGKPTVVVFFSVRCLVSGLYNERFNELYNDYIQKVTFVFINSNDEESWSEIQKYFKDNSLIFDAVKDKGKVTATALNVTKIPTAFIFKADGSLAYRGKIDNNPRVQGTIYGSQLQTNLENVINGEEVSLKETSAVGCDMQKIEKTVPKPKTADTTNGE